MERRLKEYVGISWNIDECSIEGLMFVAVAAVLGFIWIHHVPHFLKLRKISAGFAETCADALSHQLSLSNARFPSSLRLLSAQSASRSKSARIMGNLCLCKQKWRDINQNARGYGCSTRTNNS